MPVYVYILVLCFLFPGLDQSHHNTYSLSKEWAESFTGRIDDLFEISIDINCNDDYCEGELTYLRSRIKFNLKGSRNQNTFSLTELDDAGNISGHINAELNDSNFKGTWHNYDFTRGAEINLNISKNNNFIPSHCGKNKRFYSLETEGKNNKINMFLLSESNGRYSGSLFLENKNKTYLFETYSDNTSIDADLWYNNDYEGGLNIDLSEIEPVLTLQEKDKTSKHKLIYNDRLNVECIEYADYVVAYDIIHPKSRNETLNTFLDSTSDQWVDDIISTIKPPSPKTSNYKPRSRYSRLATARIHIVFMDKNYCSGYMEYYKNWDKNQFSTFTINLKNDEENLITLPTTSEEIISLEKKKILSKIIESKKMEGSLELEEWINSDPFKNYMLSHEGLILITEKHPFYGQMTINIPWDKLASSIPKKHAFYRYVK